MPRAADAAEEVAEEAVLSWPTKVVGLQASWRHVLRPLVERNDGFGIPSAYCQFESCRHQRVGSFWWKFR